jgi:lipopolysaccharide export system permease protein
MNLIDRYILKQFISTLFFALIALCVIFLIVNLMENLEEFLREKLEFSLIAKYYLSLFPEILKILTPIGMLLAVLFTFGKLSTMNEITAMKTGGLSLYRMMLPMLAISFVFSLGQLYFNGWIVPQANQTKLEIEKVYLKKTGKGGSIYDLYMKDTPLKNLILSYYNPDRREGNTVAIEEFTSKMQPRLKSRIEAQKMQWDSTGKWLLINGISRKFWKDSVSVYVFDSLEVSLNTKHHQIAQLKREPEEMTLPEYEEYIELLKRGGKDVTNHIIDYHGMIAFPFANFIVVLFGVPFASVRKKGGIAVQIAAAMIAAFSYLIFTEVGKTIGNTMGMEPILSAWLANIIFFFIGVIVVLKSRT